MAMDTPLSYRNLFLYQVYLRNHNQSGTFLELIDDLDRIKALGVDIVYLLPIHPVGEKNKKGEKGCNYSISDYRAINPENGTLDDFQQLINETHARGLKLMIDVVFNHTSHDAKLLKSHPEWYFYRDGKLANKTGDWWDVIDLDYSKDKGLWWELIDTLKYYATLGVDGYRCDVAPLIPIEFWLEARKEIKKIDPNFIWLSESVHPGFIKENRDQGFTAHSDGEVYQAFDILYDYDIHEEYMNYLTHKGSLKDYLTAIKRQEVIYPANYCKLRNLENHDQPRIAGLVEDKKQLKQWTAFIFFVKGATMIYGGQEVMNTHRPSLFDLDKVEWNFDKDHDLSDYIKTLAKIKKDPIMATGVFNVLDLDNEEVIAMTYENKDKIRYGIFNIGLKKSMLNLAIKDGKYLNLINQNVIDVNSNKLEVYDQALIFDVNKNDSNTNIR